MIAYIVFFLSSIYLSNHFKGAIVEREAEKEFGEDDWKRLLEFDKEVDETLNG